jgi:hypothetical protein
MDYPEISHIRLGEQPVAFFVFHWLKDIELIIPETDS